MGFFNETEEEKQFKDLIKRVRSAEKINIEIKQCVVTYLEKVRDKKITNDFYDFDFLERVIIELCDNEYTDREDFIAQFTRLCEVVRFLLPDGLSTDGYTGIKNMIVNNFIGEYGFIQKGLFSEAIYSLFESRYDYLFIVNLISNKENFPCTIKELYEYMCEVAPWIPNQSLLRLEMISCIEGLDDVVGNTGDYFKLRIDDAKKRVGVYPVDEKTLALIASEAEKAQGLIVKLETMQKRINTFKETMDSLVTTGKEDVASVIREGKKDISDYSANSIVQMQEAVNTAKKEIINQLDEYLVTLEQSLKRSSDAVFNQVLLDTQEKIRQIRVAAEGLTKTTTSELLRIQQTSQESVDQLRSYVEQEPELKKLLEGVKIDESLKEALLQFSSLQTGALTGAVVAPTRAGILIPGHDRLVVPANPNVVIPENPESIGILPAFDERIPFDVRLEKIFSEKRRREAEGEIYHEMTEEIIRCVMEGDWVYLWGPSGCGKSYVIKQIAELIGIDMIDNGKITDKYSIMAYNDPHGNFRATQTFVALTYGKMIKYDEFDNGNPDTHVVLNELYSGLLDVLEDPTEQRHVTFAEDMTVPIHPNFRMISAGNTSGEGENAIFSSRGKMDESVQERMTPKRVNYDNRVEARIFGEFTAWYDLFVNFRTICDAYAKREGLDTPPGMVTTRDASAIVKYIKHNSKSVDQVLREKFVQTKSDSYLKFIMKQAQEIYGLDGVSEPETDYSYLSEVPSEELGKRLVLACNNAIKNGRK